MQGQSWSKNGLGFQNKQIYTCCMMLVVNSSDGNKENPIGDAVDDHPPKDTKDVPPELEDGEQSTINELVKINLGSKDYPKPTILSA